MCGNSYLDFPPFRQSHPEKIILSAGGELMV
jgi:hypothetical protein